MSTDLSGLPDLAGPRFEADPYPAYQALRANEPVHWVTFRDGLYGWLVSRYEDARTALSDPRLSKDPRVAPPDWQEAGRGRPLEDRSGLGEHLLTLDPPDHTRLRRLVGSAFTPRRVESMRDRIQEIADSLVDEFAAREADLISQFAFPMSVTVICELLGIPEDRRADFREWSTNVVSSEPGADDKRPAALQNLHDYFLALIAQRRAEPAGDFVSALVAASDEDDQLSESEVLAMLFLLLIAGHESTVNMIGNGVLALLRHPDQLEMLRERPELIAPAVEEFLRYDGPVELATWRFATEPVEIGGTQVKTGDPILVVLASADHDERKFAEPGRLDVAREDNPHLAFGQGIHYCLGAPLARLEGQIAFGTLLRRLTDLELSVPPERLVWQHSLFMRGLRGLPVSFSVVP